MMKTKIKARTATALAPLLWAALLHNAMAGPIYRCERGGKVIFTDQACGDGSAAIEPAAPNTMQADKPADLARQYDQRLVRERTARDKADAAFAKETAQRRAEEERLRKARVEGRVVAGMSAADLRQLWGEPDEISQSASRAGQQERWTWREGKVRRSAVLVDGRVRSASAAGRK